MSKNKKPKNENLKALPRAKSQIKILEGTVDKQKRRITRLENDLERAHQENEKLKKELEALRKPPKWVKANKNKNPDGSLKPGKKRGPKKGHKPHVRKVPEAVDEEVRWTPLTCEECESSLPAPRRWHNHYQVDLPLPTQALRTKHIVGWSWCRTCKKEVSSAKKLESSLYGPRLHAQVCYWKYELGLSLGKIQKLLCEQYNMKISRGVLSGMISRTARRLNGAYEDIGSKLSDQGHLYADETGWRVNGNNYS